MFTTKTLTHTDLKLLQEKYPKNYSNKIKKVEKGYPIQYLIGNVEFLNTTINVNKNVLIPRFETEYLVEKILTKLKKYTNQKLNIIDICTGSGCIAIALAKNTNFNYIGLDISKKALKLAEINNQKNNTSVKFIKKNILKDQLPQDFDVIISNPPYISKEENVDNSTKYEPKIALYAKNNGIIFYQRILDIISNQPKLIAFEINETKGNDLINLAKTKFPTATITLEKDLCGKDRYLFIEH